MHRKQPFSSLESMNGGSIKIKPHFVEIIVCRLKHFCKVYLAEIDSINFGFFPVQHFCGAASPLKFKILRHLRSLPQTIN